MTRLEEVDIEAQAEDDYGIDRLDLVYSVRGRSGEGRCRFQFRAAPRRSTGRHTLFLEDLDVQPGDFVSYYVRARDLTRGTRPNEARSDIFFLEVKPFEQEFALAQKPGDAGGRHQVASTISSPRRKRSGRRHLEAGSAGARRRGREVGAGHPRGRTRRSRAEDARRADVELFRESTMRDPRRRGSEAAAPLPRGQTMPEEDAMTAAGRRWGRPSPRSTR